MHSMGNLPEGYSEIFSVDMQKNKKLAFILNGVALVVGVIMAVPMLFVVPISTLFDMSDGLGVYALRFVVLVAAMVAYIVLHELVHGVTMKLFGCEKINYGFTGLYAFAGSDWYFDKVSYITIALAPVVFWGIVLAVICALVPQQWFWVAYIIQICNVSGAAGDAYVTVKFSKMPSDILVHDNGVSMRVYSQKRG